jgi:hypothetical protein
MGTAPHSTAQPTAKSAGTPMIAPPPGAKCHQPARSARTFMKSSEGMHHRVEMSAATARSRSGGRTTQAVATSAIGAYSDSTLIAVSRSIVIELLESPASQ